MQHVSTQRGFSLIELLVSMALFAVVMTMAVSTLLVLIDANAKAQNMQDVMTNFTFVLDSMTREIRTGYGYYCSSSLPENISTNATRDCTRETGMSIIEGGSSLTEDAGSPRIAYRVNSGAIERRVGTESWLTLTSDTVEITNMYFTVTGSDTYSAGADTEQPTVTLFIEGQAGTDDAQISDFSVQTTITRRTRDI